MTFQEWCDECDRLFSQQFSQQLVNHYTQVVGRESFRSMYDEGQTPQEAVNSEAENFSDFII